MMTSVAAPLPRLPYRGIEPFRYADQSIFAVREEEIWDLVSLITIYRGVLLYGESGTGKSSLIDAGLIPTAQTKGYVIDKLRVQPSLGSEIKVERISATDADGPPYLPSAFADDRPGGEGVTQNQVTLSIDDFAARVKSFVEESAAQGAEGRQPLLIFDQFEEIVTIFDEVMRGERDTGQQRQAREEARRQAPIVQARIVETLLEFLLDDSLPVKILFVFRADYLAKVSALFELYHDILDQYLYLQPPRAEELQEIIRAPFEKLHGHFTREIDEGLAEDVAADIRKRSEGGAVNLTELQIACLMLWESPDPEKEFAEKGVRGLLQEYWERELGKMSAELLRPATALLTHMLTATNTRNIISGKELIDRVLEEEEEEASDEYKGRLVRALQALTQTKLVRRELRYDTYFYEIVSEFIVPRIVQQKAQREAELALRKREKEAKLQTEREREIEKLELKREREVARQKQSRQRWVIIALILFLLAVSVTTLLFYQQRAAAQEAQKQAEEASLRIKEASARIEDERKRREEIYDLLKNLNSPFHEQRLKAIQQINALAQSHTLPPGVGSTLLLSVVTDKDPEVSKAAYDLLVEAAKDDPQIGQAIGLAAEVVDANAADKLPPRVFIQIESEQQRPHAEQAKAALENKNIIVPGIEVVGPNRTPAVTQLRYRSEDKDRADEVMKTLRSAGIKATSLSSIYVSRAGQLELWFGSDFPSERWFVRIDFTFDTITSRESIERALKQAVAQQPGVNITFDGSSARVGPLDKESATRLKNDIPNLLGGQPSINASLEKDESN
jgi:hypothetical protein